MRSFVHAFIGMLDAFNCQSVDFHVTSPFPCSIYRHPSLRPEWRKVNNHPVL